MKCRTMTGCRDNDMTRAAHVPRQDVGAYAIVTNCERVWRPQSDVLPWSVDNERKHEKLQKQKIMNSVFYHWLLQQRIHQPSQS